ncbi:hypothetical protein [Micromonospora sp. NPDC005806]
MARSEPAQSQKIIRASPTAPATLTAQPGSWSSDDGGGAQPAGGV